jgi:anti-sigma factor RsiW
MNKERHAVKTPAPSDVELMMYHDGELEEPRRSEVAAFVGSNSRARNKVTGLRLASALVQEQAQALSAADDIADLVMAKIGATSGSPSRANGMSAAEPQPLPLAPIVAAPRGAVANDNGRRILVGVTALVAVAAAVLAVWSRQPSGPSDAPTLTPVAVQTAAQSPSTARTPPATPPSTASEIDAAALSPDTDSEHGVEVAAVNFGAHMGSIFYVPSGSVEANRTTTVVWLADDAGE